MELVPLLWIAAIAAIFWLFIIRPASRRQKEIARVQAAVEVGTEVVLTSGIFATVVATDDAHLEVEVAPGVAIKVARAAVGQVIPDSDEAYDVYDEDRAGHDDHDDHDAGTAEPGEER